MTESRLAFFEALVKDPLANSLVRKSALQRISFMGIPALEPLLECAGNIPDEGSVKVYAIELLRAFDKRYGRNGLDAESEKKLRDALQKLLAAEGPA
jgi:hypothetical protein